MSVVPSPVIDVRAGAYVRTLCGLMTYVIRPVTKKNGFLSVGPQQWALTSHLSGAIATNKRSPIVQYCSRIHYRGVTNNWTHIPGINLN